MKLYSVKDKKAEEYGSPMAMPTDAHAVRSFTQEINRADAANMLNQYPEDFCIYRIGSFDQNTGELTPEKTMLLEAVAAKRPVN